MKTSALRTRSFRRILLIKPSAFGDVVHTLPVLVKLRERYPAARIDWLVTPENAELVRYHPALSNVVLFDRRGYARRENRWSAFRNLGRLVTALWRTRYDLVVDLHGQFRSAMFVLASGAGTRIGFDRPRRSIEPTAAQGQSPAVGRHGWFGAREGSWRVYSQRIPIPTLAVHAVDRYLWLAPLLGLNDQPPDMRVYWPTQADEHVDALLAQQGLQQQPFAILVPSTIWPTKHWHVDGFAQVGRFCLRNGLAVVLAGSSKDGPRCQEVAAACPGARDLSGQTTLSEFAALMNRAAVNITNDSGSMHLAVALNRPVVSVFGPTDPIRVGPYGRPHAVVRSTLPCQPCHLRKISQCPHQHACMQQVTPDMVIDRLQSMLRELRPAA
jgi:lipopolysaccharide heptosyltransferase I